MSDWVIRLIDAGGYWGIGFLMVLENVFPPIPSELIMGVGGIRVGQGRLEMIPLLIAGTIGTTIGNVFWYWIGRQLGLARVEKLVERHGRWMTLHWRDVEWLDSMFERHGQKLVFIFRFMPAFRTMISLPAGIFRMGAIRFLMWTMAGALIWNIILAGGGYWLGARFSSEIDAWLGPAANLCIVGALLFYLWRQWHWKDEEQAGKN